MIQLSLKSTGNITGNSYAIGSSALCNAKPNLFCGFLTSGVVATFRDGGPTGPIVWYVNNTAGTIDRQIFDWPIYCANGVYVNTTAAANTVFFLG